MLGLTGINQELSSRDPQGGVRRVLLIPTKDLNLAAASINPTTKKVTLAVIAAEQALYVPYESTALFNSNGASEGESHRSTIEGLLEFIGITDDIVAEGERIKSVKSWAAVVEYANCMVCVYGLDIVEGCSADPELRRSLKRLKPIVSHIFGTIEEDDMMRVAFEGTQKTTVVVIDTSVQDFDDILALTI